MSIVVVGTSHFPEISIVDIKLVGLKKKKDGKPFKIWQSHHDTIWSYSAEFQILKKKDLQIQDQVRKFLHISVPSAM
jgi:hemerythrin superfamily protein